MDYDRVREMEWLLGGDITKITKNETEETVDPLVESFAAFFGAFDMIELDESLQESIQDQSIMDEFIKIQEAMEVIKEKMGDKLNEDALAGALLTPMLVSLSGAILAAILGRYTSGDTIIPMPVLKTIWKITNWISGDDKKKVQFKTALAKHNPKLSGSDVSKVANVVASREEMMKRFPRLATK